MVEGRPPGGTRVSLRRRQSIYVHPLRRTSGRDRSPALHRLGRRQLRKENALAETVNGLYKTELIRRRGPWRNVDDVELATLGWVHWFNTTRLHAAPRRCPTGGVRSRLLPSARNHRAGWNPITRASIKPRALHSLVDDRCGRKADHNDGGPERGPERWPRGRSRPLRQPRAPGRLVRRCNEHLLRGQPGRAYHEPADGASLRVWKAKSTRNHLFAPSVA